MFLSTYEKQLDGKRRLLIPNDFRTTENGAAGGVFIFPSIEADCLEAGGDRLFAVYAEMIEALPFGSEERSALEWQVMGEQVRLASIPAVGSPCPRRCAPRRVWATPSSSSA